MNKNFLLLGYSVVLLVLISHPRFLIHASETRVVGKGYHFIFNPPNYAIVDVPLLLTHVLVSTLIFGALLLRTQEIDITYPGEKMDN